MDLEKMTVRILGDKVLKTELCMIAPDVEIDDGQGTILISSEEGETDDIADKLLKVLISIHFFNNNKNVNDYYDIHFFLNSKNFIKDGTRLKCDDFLQNYQINITVAAMVDEEDEKDREKSGILFEIIGDRTQLNAKEQVAEGKKTDDQEQPSTSKKGSISDNCESVNKSFHQCILFCIANPVHDDEDDLMIIEPTTVSEVQVAGTKRRLDETEEDTPSKKRKVESETSEVIDID